MSCCVLSVCLHYEEGRMRLFEKEGGSIRSEEVLRFPIRRKEEQNLLVWDIDAIYEDILDGLRECKKRNRIPSSIGITGWASDYVLLDENNKRLCRPCDGMDRRRWLDGEEMERIIPEAELYSLTGRRKLPFSTLYQLTWDRLYRPKLFAKARYMLQLSD